MEDIKDKERLYLERLSYKFNKQYFCEFIGDLLNLECSDIVNGIKEQPIINEQYKNYIDSVEEYAKYNDNLRNIIGILIIKLQANKVPANARTIQRNYIAHLLEYYDLDAALAAIYSETDDNWRLSFVKKETTIELGKIKTNLSPAKRYSYLFGKDEPNHTAKNQLFELLKNNEKKYTVDEIEFVFSVEKVTKDFFEKYKDNYLKIKEMLEKNEDFISESTRCDFTSEEFTKKLMGQLVFLYFLQKKGWLGVPIVPQFLSLAEYNKIYSTAEGLQKKVLDEYYITHEGKKRIVNSKIEKVEENKQELEILSDIFVNSKYNLEWGKGQKQFVRKIFNKAVNMKKNFFDDFLEPFFYQGLNSSRKNQYFGLFNSKVPFLNGGLFEPLDNYNWKVAKFKIDNSIFSNEEENGILDFFERYNFTINEEEPLEKEVAVDPEMLGKIFENLLDIKDRKSKGAFYTPREIVHYMCQESLANYLVNKVGVDYQEIKDLIQYGEIMKDEDMKGATKENHLLGDTVFNNITKVDRALENIKVADPSVGSGAFPLGMLNEIVKVRDIITSYMLIHNRLGLFNREYPEEAIYKKRNIYNIKWNTIKNCIYAVDIENSAVDITKLRLWLSLVVDQNEVSKEGPQPLPNLDCKIMQGNSLIDEYNGIKLIDEELIESSKGEFVIKAEGKKGLENQMRFLDNTPEFAQLGFYTDEKRALINDLIKAKSELFGTTNSEEKKRLLDKIKRYREELFKVNFRSKGSNGDRLNELLEVDKTHNKPYFSWKLEFIEVFVNNGGFDIVIGNPPYVSTKGITDEEKKQYIKIYGFADDLYYHFIHFGLNVLLKEKGINTMITPDTYFTILTKKKLRKEILDNKLLELVDLGYDIFESAMVSTAIIIVEKNEKEKNSNTIIKDVKGVKELKKAKTYIINQNLYCDSINNAFFIPDYLNLLLNKKLKDNHKNLIDQYWEKINTSRNIIKNYKDLEEYRKNLKPGDFTIVGLITEGGQGLATGNNGKYLGIREGTKEAERVKTTRKVKLEQFNREHKTNYELPDTEEEIWNLFDSLKEKFGRDIFGQGYVYKIVKNSLLADIETLTEYQKENGIENEKTFVPYDKGDKEGNRWYFDNPFLINWSKKNVETLKSNAGKKGHGGSRFQNSKFYFKEGFCYMDVNTYYLKARKKGKSIHDVMGMSFFPLLENIPVYYLITIINSEIIARLVFNFLNNTSHFQINDCRMLPIPIPNDKELKKIKQLFDKAVDIQKLYFSDIISKDEKEQKLINVQKEVDNEVFNMYIKEKC